MVNSSYCGTADGVFCLGAALWGVLTHHSVTAVDRSDDSLSHQTGQPPGAHIFTVSICNQSNKSKVQLSNGLCRNLHLLLEYFSTQPKVNICTAVPVISASSLAVLHLFLLASLLTISHSSWHVPYIFVHFPTFRA